MQIKCSSCLCRKWIVLVHLSSTPFRCACCVEFQSFFALSLSGTVGVDFRVLSIVANVIYFACKQLWQRGPKRFTGRYCCWRSRPSVLVWGYISRIRAIRVLVLWFVLSRKGSDSQSCKSLWSLLIWKTSFFENHGRRTSSFYHKYIKTDFSACSQWFLCLIVSVGGGRILLGTPLMASLSLAPSLARFLMETALILFYSLISHCLLVLQSQATPALLSFSYAVCNCSVQERDRVLSDLHSKHQTLFSIYFLSVRSWAFS